MPDIIKTHGLTKYYGKSRGIVGLELSVAEGEIFGFIGPNGAGKSTTIRTLLGLISPTSGSAEIFGKDIIKGKQKILPEVGYMPSEAMFYGSMRVAELIKYSADLRSKDCSAESKRLCEMLQIETKKKIEELSLGNRKKVGIVCALQHKPSLYILDEPTSSLDPLMQKEFFSLLEERNREGATVFLSSHILSEVQNHCGRAAIIKDGKLIVCDTVVNLTKTSAKYVTLTGVITAPELQGITDINKTRNTVSFMYRGNVKTLLTALNGLALTDVNINEPSLEDIFLHYYSTEAGK